MIVLDTSAFISLSTADSLSLILEEFDIQTTETVITELEETAEYEDIHGVAASAVLDQSSNFTVSVVPELKLSSSRIDQGEASCVHLCRNLEADFLITDDLRALPELQSVTPVQVAISPIMLKVLVKRGRLTETEAKNRLDQLAKKRDWLESPIYRRAQNLFDD